MYTTVLQYLEETQKKFPQKVVYADMEESYTFSELRDAAMRIGSAITETVPPRQPVVVYMDKRAYDIVTFLGVVYAGCYYVPIDSQMPAERVNLILETLQPGMMIYDDTTRDKAALFEDGMEKRHYKDLLQSEIRHERLDAIRKATKTTDLLYVLFTSGSTGKPKGVTISQAAVMDKIEWMCDAYQLQEDCVLCNQAPFYFDVSVPDLYIPLRVGATMYVPPKTYYTFPKKILQFLEEKKVNTIVWVPSALCNVVNCRAFEVCVPSSLKLVIFCGEVMPCKHLNVWRNYIPDALYVNMYGPTEATYACMYYNITRPFANDEKLPLGKACENSEILLLNDNNEVTKEGEIGEICILGQCLSHGYYNMPEKTKGAFVQNPLNHKWREPMYRTGDLAFKNADGDIMFVGRKDSQIKRLGHRIELGEIENAILSIEGIENACCIFNSETSDIIAVYTGKTEEDGLVKKLESKISHYMLPTKTVHLPAMPMNLNGKIDRAMLKQTYAG